MEPKPTNYPGNARAWENLAGYQTSTGKPCWDETKDLWIPKCLCNGFQRPQVHPCHHAFHISRFKTHCRDHQLSKLSCTILTIHPFLTAIGFGLTFNCWAICCCYLRYPERLQQSTYRPTKHVWVFYMVIGIGYVVRKTFSILAFVFCDCTTRVKNNKLVAKFVTHK